MPRIFNTAGPCLAEKHYMIPTGRRLGQLRSLIDEEKFFVIHAPRQTGKTTLLRNLSRELTAEGSYVAITVSLECYTEPSVERMIPQVLGNIRNSSEDQLAEELLPPKKDDFIDEPNNALKHYLKAWSASIELPLVVFFDEADSVPGPVLLSILRQLRDGYTARPASFPQSIALTGMRDVRDYKIQIRKDSESLGTASPFNIKDESLTLRNFNADEVEELLQQHTVETGQSFAQDAVAEIVHQTKGQPWLVNALAAQLATRYDALVKDRRDTVTRDQVLEAREILIERRDTHLDSLVDKLGENRVRKIIEPIMVGETLRPDVYNDDLQYAEDLGIISRATGAVQIANPIYQEIIPRTLTHVTQSGIPDEPSWYVSDDGTLNLRKLIKGFLRFWSRHGEVLLRGMPYQEAAPHLVFMAYLQRITNGGGNIDREFAIGTGRADLVVCFGGREDVIELKLQRGKYTLPEGLEQVARYAKRLQRDVGYLIIFDPKSETPWEDRGEVEETKQDCVTVVVVKA
ncbi:MAG: ATP-binding protein [Proteobacteria bacterium]|nr:ATP-binding protein [Pseudomonadota bacterium]